MMFRRKLLNVKCVLAFSVTLPETFLILRRIHRDIVINVHQHSCKLPVILFIFRWNLNFLDRFSKDSREKKFMKICPVVAELLRAD